MTAVLAEIRDITAWLLEFVQRHHQWAAPIAFALAFVKSLPFFPLIIPGTALLVAIGSLIGASGIDFVPVWVAISVERRWVIGSPIGWGRTSHSP